MSRRPNLPALALSAALVGGGLAALAGWHPGLSGIGIMQSGGGSGGEEKVTTPPRPRGCRAETRVIHGGTQFEPNCAGQAGSFDGRYFVVKNAGPLSGVGLVRGGTGQSLDDLGVLDDSYGFTLFWSPRDYRFFANQQHPLGRDRLRLFDVRQDRVVERAGLHEAAAAELRRRRPCLGDRDIGVSGVRWSDEGLRIVIIAYARRGACGSPASWRSLWMVADAASARIDPASVRYRSGRDPLPADGPYAQP